MYTTLNIELIIVVCIAIGRGADSELLRYARAFLVFNTLLIFLVTSAMAVVTPERSARVFESVGITDPQAMGLVDFAIHTLPLVLVSPWFADAAERPWMLLAPIATILAYRVLSDDAWVYHGDLGYHGAVLQDKEDSKHTPMVDLWYIVPMVGVMYATTLAAWAAVH